LGVMWLTLIVAETISTHSGIGYMAMNAREFMQMDVIVLSIVLYAMFGKLLDMIARYNNTYNDHIHLFVLSIVLYEIFGKLSDMIARYFENKLLKWNT